MKSALIHHEDGNRRLILIFAGWGSDARLYGDVTAAGWDTAVVWDYRDMQFDHSLTAGYDTVYLYAWSMGVDAALRSLRDCEVTAAFAVNGTGTPRHDLTGIPEAIYDGTADSLDVRNLKKFRLRMAGNRETAAFLDTLLPAPDIATLQEELRAIARRAGEENTIPPQERLKWRRAYISGNDRIFPTEAQKRYWTAGSPQAGLQKATETVIISGAPHYIPLSEIVKGTICDLKKVGQRFRSALPSYDSHADAQRIIADRLTRLIGESVENGMTRPGGRMLEIGSGSGLLTRMAVPVLLPRAATYVDLYPLLPYGLCREEEYVEDDAENWIGRQNDEWDYIVSGSAIQWFADLRRFLDRCARCLRHGGLFAASTFTKGNLKELDALRPAPLMYHTADEIRSMVNRSFTRSVVTEDEITLHFRHMREAMLHLKRTGVGGSASNGPGTAPLKIAGNSSITLTYRACWIIAYK